MNNKEKVRNSIIEGTISLTIATVIVKVLGAIYKIPISNILGEEGMGYFNSAYTVYSFFYLICTAGVPKAIMILIGKNTEENNYNNEKKIMQTAISFYALVGLLITIIFIVFSKPLAVLIGSRDSYKTMLAIAPSILFVAVAGVLRGYMSAYVKFLHVAVSQIIEGVGKLVFGLIFAHIADRLYMPLSTISAFTIFGVTLGSLIGLIYLHINIKTAKINKKAKQNRFLIDKSIIKDILKISIPITISAAVMSITNMIDLALIMRRLTEGGFSESEATALYGNYTTYATPMFNLIVSLLTPITIAFMPSLVKSSGNKKSFTSILEKELSLIFWLSVPLTFGMCVYSREVLDLLFNGEGIEMGSVLLTYLSVSLVFMSPLLVLNSALEAQGEIKAPMISMIIGSVFKLIISYILISNPNFGILGAPLGTIASYVIAFGVSLVIAYKRKGIVLPIIKTISLPIINSFIAVIAVYPVYLKGYNANSTLSFIVAVLFTMLIYILLSVSKDFVSNLKNLRMQNAQSQI